MFKKDTNAIVQVIVYLAIGFVIWRVWQDPSGSAQTAGDFFGAIGSFVSTTIDKSSEFLKSLFN